MTPPTSSKTSPERLREDLPERRIESFFYLAGASLLSLAAQPFLPDYLRQILALLAFTSLTKGFHRLEDSSVRSS
jgi:hypothetical protein